MEGEVLPPLSLENAGVEFAIFWFVYCVLKVRPQPLYLTTRNFAYDNVANFDPPPTCSGKSCRGGRRGGQECSFLLSPSAFMRVLRPDKKSGFSALQPPPPPFFCAVAIYSRERVPGKADATEGIPNSLLEKVSNSFSSKLWVKF